MENLIFTLFGILFGSHLNVLIYRLPLHKKTTTPSACPYCKHKIKWYQNIPIFSYLFLNGKCYFCKHTIPVMFLYTEVMSGLVFFIVSYKLGVNLNAFLLAYGLLLLFGISVIHYNKQKIPIKLFIFSFLLIFIYPLKINGVFLESFFAIILLIYIYILIIIEKYTKYKKNIQKFSVFLFFILTLLIIFFNFFIIPLKFINFIYIF